MLRKTFSIVCVLVFATTAFAFGDKEEPQSVSKIEFYQARYPLKDVFQKQVDNKGDGDERIYGTRNFRAVLNGVLYRGGANNKYNKYGVRDNRNPLPDIGHKSLCEEGFMQGFYLYTTNLETAPPQSSCNSLYGAWTFKYSHQSPYNPAGLKAIFTAVKKSIDNNSGPIYMHCWNGWHASGLASALALRQFCGVSATKAVTYWDQNTDGNNTDPNFEPLRKTIREFVPMAEFKISADIQDRICPEL